MLFATRAIRLSAYGAVSVVLVFYLVELGFDESQTGLLLTATLVGDTLVSLYLTTRADRIGRRRMLIIGVISPSGGEVGPFLSIEQAALSHVVTDRNRTELFAWYTLAGSIATALGALIGGALADGAQRHWSVAPVTSYRAILFLYAALGVVLAILFTRVSPAAEAITRGEKRPFRATLAGLSGLEHSRHVVFTLSGLFALDSFGGGFVIQSFAAYWFYLRFGGTPETLGVVFFAANVLAGISALLASRLATRFGLLNTMVATHLPSNVLLILVPLMPTLPLAVMVLLVRFSISQMDVPTRQSYVMAVVRPDERSAAAGITGVARTMGAAISPLFAGLLFAHPSLINVPFFIAGSLKLAYDLLLYREFKAIRPPEDVDMMSSSR